MQSCSLPAPPNTKTDSTFRVASFIWKAGSVKVRQTGLAACGMRNRQRPIGHSTGPNKVTTQKTERHGCDISCKRQNKTCAASPPFHWLITAGCSSPAFEGGCRHRPLLPMRIGNPSRNGFILPTFLHCYDAAGGGKGKVSQRNSTAGDGPSPVRRQTDLLGPLRSPGPKPTSAGHPPPGRLAWAAECCWTS